MKLTKTAIIKAFSMSDVPGVVSIKRFSQDKVRIRRFSDDGEVISDKVVEDPELADKGTEDLVEEIPAKDVAVFSDQDNGVDEIITEVDGGDATPVLEAKAEEGYQADDDDEAVAAESGEDEAPEAESEEEAAEEPVEPTDPDEDDSTAKAFSKKREAINVAE